MACILKYMGNLILLRDLMNSKDIDDSYQASVEALFYRFLSFIFFNLTMTCCQKDGTPDSNRTEGLYPESIIQFRKRDVRGLVQITDSKALSFSATTKDRPSRMSSHGL